MVAIFCKCVLSWLSTTSNNLLDSNYSGNSIFIFLLFGALSSLSSSDSGFSLLPKLLSFISLGSSAKFLKSSEELAVFFYSRIGSTYFLRGICFYLND